jgi:hypothetical protein
LFSPEFELNSVIPEANFLEIFDFVGKLSCPGSRFPCEAEGSGIPDCKTFQRKTWRFSGNA